MLRSKKGSTQDKDKLTKEKIEEEALRIAQKASRDFEKLQSGSGAERKSGISRAGSSQQETLASSAASGVDQLSKLKDLTPQELPEDSQNSAEDTVSQVPQILVHSTDHGAGASFTADENQQEPSSPTGSIGSSAAAGDQQVQQDSKVAGDLQDLPTATQEQEPAVSLRQQTESLPGPAGDNPTATATAAQHQDQDQVQLPSPEATAVGSAIVADRPAGRDLPGSGSGDPPSANPGQGAASTQSAVSALLLWEDMDLLGLTAKERSSKQWQGQKGVTFLEFKQQEQNEQTLLRANATGRGLLCSAGMALERVTTRIKPDSIADKDVAGFIEDLQEPIIITELGFCPRPEDLAPLAARARAKKRRPAGVPVDSILDQLLQDRVEPVYQLALRHNCAIRDDAHRQEVLANMTKNPLILNASSGAGGSGGVLGTIGSCEPFMRVRIKGRVMTPDALVLLVFWELLSIVYAASEEAEKEFYAMGFRGKQGSLDLRAYAEEVSRVYSCVKHVVSISEQELPRVFCRGLNNDSTYQHSQQELGRNRLISLDSLVDLLEEFERHNLVEDVIDSKQARLLPELARSSARGHKGSRPGVNHDGSGSTGKSKLDQLRSSRASQLQKLEQEDPATHMAIMHAMQMAEKHPGHPTAICLDCSRGKLHTNEKCPNAKAAGSQVRFANVVEYIPRGSGTSAGSGATGSQKQEQSGLFRAVPKPDSGKGRGGRSFGYQQERTASERGSNHGSRSGCHFCRWETPHEGGVCYYQQPRMAPSYWKGPSDSTPVDVILAYLEQCAQQQVPPRVSRCPKALEHLRSTGQLTPAVWNILSPPNPNWNQQRRPSGTHVVAAAQTGSWPVTGDPVLPDNPWTQEPRPAADLGPVRSMVLRLVPLRRPCPIGSSGLHQPTWAHLVASNPQDSPHQDTTLPCQ